MIATPRQPDPLPACVRRRGPWSRVPAGALALVLAASSAAAKDPALPDLASRHGGEVDELFWLATWLGAVAFAIVVGILVYCMVVFRERPGHTAVYTHGDSKKARTGTLIFAIAVFVILDVNLAIKDHHVYTTMYGDMPAAGEALEVECLARQFEWHFRYPGKDGEFGTEDDIRSLETLRIPDDTRTVVRMRSIDVIHSFFLPHFRTKQDAVPGMTTITVIDPVVTGKYEIACAELCGLSHYKMRGVVQVLPRAEYDAWMAAQQAEIEEYGAMETGEEYWEIYRRTRREEGE